MLNQTIQIYKIKKEIGRGGMATVYLGENSIGKKVAIKVLEKQYFHNEQIKKRFVQEAKLMVSLEHDNICTVNALEDNDEYCAIIMEYLEGQDLGSYVYDKGAVSEKVLLGWLEQMADAMDYAHGEKVVHRDIKPSNFFLTKKGQVKIMDFGIAKQAENMMGTRTDSKMGSVIYMSPEQIKSPKYVDFKTDIYSLGVALYHLATGNIPYDIGTESEFEVMTSITQKPLPDLSDKNSRINAIIQAATQKDPKDRPNKVVDLLSISPQVSDATVIETGAPEEDPDRKQIVSDNTIFERTENSEKENKPIVSQTEIKASTSKKVNTIKTRNKGINKAVLIIPVLLIISAVWFLIINPQRQENAKKEQLNREWSHFQDQVQAGEQTRLQELAKQQQARKKEQARIEQRRQTVKIGDIEFGGIIFYLKNGHGLVAAQEDLGLYAWGGGAYACRQLSLNGFDDWRLPTKNELNLMYKNHKILDLSEECCLDYWSTTEYNRKLAWGQDVRDGFGNQNRNMKEMNGRIRPIRTF